MVLVAVASVPSARPLQPEPFYPPQKNFPGEVRGYQEPSGARHRQTGQDIPPGLNRQGQDRTAHRNRKPSWAGLEAEASSGHDRVRGPHRVPQQPLPLRRQGPRRVSMNKTDMIIKMFLWAQQDKHSTPGHDEWTESTGLGIATASGHESALIRRA